MSTVEVMIPVRGELGGEGKARRRSNTCCITRRSNAAIAVQCPRAGVRTSAVDI